MESCFCFVSASKLTINQLMQIMLTTRLGPLLTFKVLKRIGIEQLSYHGGCLNENDIKKVMNNATYLFEEFSSILKSGKARQL